MRRKGTLGLDTSAQTAIADAVIALIIISIASVVIYSAVAGVVSQNSESRQRADLRSTALQSSNLPLEGAYPVVSFTNLSSGEVQVIHNTTGEQLFTIIFELRAHSNRTDDRYNLSGLEVAIRTLYQWAFEGRSYAVHASGTVDGTTIEMLFSSELTDGKDTINSIDIIPHPRIVTQKTIHGTHSDISVELYLWQ